MKAKEYKLPRDVWRELADWLDGGDPWRDCEHGGLQTAEFEFTSRDGRWFITGEADGVVEWVDDSFSHEFGVCECGHWELQDVDNYTINAAWYTDDDGNDHKVTL